MKKKAEPRNDLCPAVRSEAIRHVNPRPRGSGRARPPGERLRGQAAEGRVVVEDVDAAAERADDQVVHLLLDGQVAHGDGRQAALEANPLLAAVDA